MNKARKKYIQSCEVSELVDFNLGGYGQRVLIEGKSKDLPVVITLHGGPGSPVPFSVGCRGLFPEWTDKAIMVYWDQLGCGINNFKLDDGFGIDDFVAMTCDLVSEIKKRFPRNKLFLFGVSWGSVLALSAAARVPDKIDGVLVYGQVLKNLFFNEEVASALACAPAKARRSAESIFRTGTDCEYAVLDKNLKTLYKLLNKYTDAYTNKNGKPAPIGGIIRGLLTSPDYSFRDFTAVMDNGYRRNTSLWRELLNIDLTPLLSEVRVRYLILQGDTDIITSTKSVLEAVKNCGNENLTVEVVENSGHLPSETAMLKCFDTLLQIIR